MKKGFKAWAERESVSLREQLDLPGHAPLPMRRLARHLGHLVIMPSQIPGITQSQLAALAPARKSGWSALCIPTESAAIIIYNSAHSDRRQESDLAHEISHLICGHRPERFVEAADGVRLVSGHNIDQEEEAKWLGGCLQLPKPALLRCLFDELTDEQIAERYCASEAMVRYRKNQSGAMRIVERSRAAAR